MRSIHAHSKTARGAVPRRPMCVIRPVALGVALALWGPLALSGPPLPTSGEITVGAGSITENGNALTVNQSSQNLAANWQSFDIAADHAVIFQQPNSSSVALNRVIGSDASSIHGSLTANGHVFLVNPSGVLFAPGSQVSTGGLVASTLKISDEDFAAGRYRFSDGKSAGSVVNEGTIEAGSVALLGPKVVNRGTIRTPGGNGTLAAGDGVTVSLLNGLITAEVDAAVANAEIRNQGQIVADGGSVAMLAGRADSVLESLINTDGVIQASSIRDVNGKIYLDAGAGGTVTVSGTLDASGNEAGAQGGEVTLLGKHVGLMAGAAVDASGNAGGGTVLVGGNWQGKGPEHNAEATYMDQDAAIRADAGEAGDGGTVVLWSDDYTGFYGDISARGGTQGGDGGAIETSSHGQLQAFGQADAAAPQGAAGEWLLDPANVTITSLTSNGSFDGGDPDVFTPDPGAGNSNVSAVTINSQLNAGTSVTIRTTNDGTNPGDITVNAPISKTAGGDATLRLEADRHISVLRNIVSTTGALDIILNAHYSDDAAPGMVYLSGVTLDSLGGDIVIGGGSDPTTIPTIGEAGTRFGRGVFFDFGATLTAGGGDIFITGQGADSTVAGDTGEGISFEAGIVAIGTAGAGNITIEGTGSSSGVATNPVGVWLQNGGGSMTISAASGAVSVTGTGGTTTGAVNSAGIGFNGNPGEVSRIYSVSGPLEITGISQTASAPAIQTLGGTTYLGWDGAAAITTGDVTILGQTASGSTLGAGGLNLTDTFINGNGGNLTIGSTGAELSGLTLGSGLIDAGASWNDVTIGDAGTGEVVSDQALTAGGDIAVASAGDTTINAALISGGDVTLTAGADDPVSPTTVPNGSVTGGDLMLNAAVQAGPGRTVTIYSGNATTASYTSQIAGSATSINKSYVTTAGTGPVDPSKALNVFYRVSPQATLSGVTAQSRVYDGTTVAVVDFSSATLSGAIDGDTLVVQSVTGEFVTPNAGSGLTVNLDATLGATNPGVALTSYSYDIVGTAAADITPAALTVTAAADSKVYDGTTSSTAAPILSGLVAGDTTSGSAVQQFDDRHVGSGKTLTAQLGTLLINDGNGGANYTVNFVDSATGEITPAVLTVTPAADSKVYDGTTSSAATATVSGLFGTDTTSGAATQSFENRHAGSGKTLTAELGTLAVNDGNGGANYTISFVDAATGEITPATLTVTAVPDSKVYDGTTDSTATPNVTGGALVGGDSFSTLAQEYETAEVGTGLTLIPLVAIEDGNGGGNYALTLVNDTTGAIEPPASPGPTDPPPANGSTTGIAHVAADLAGDGQGSDSRRDGDGSVRCADRIDRDDCVVDEDRSTMYRVIATGLKLPSGVGASVLDDFERLLQ